MTFDARSFVVRGRRQLLISGEVHYPRVPRAEWAAALDRSAAAGLTCISTYVFWNVHEPERDRYDFGGERDLAHFLRLCHERGLAVILRVGPYVCAEWNYGGYPFYLREEPGLRLRTWNGPYQDRVERYFQRLAAEVRPLLATQGGPVILVQVENEYDNVAKRYGADGARYLDWMARLAQRLGFDVPTITCEGDSPETASCRVDGTVECVNGFAISRARIARFRDAHPGRPLLWTELWPGWYDTWGRQVHRREARNIAYWVLDFIGQGGAGWNYYMWCAGTNFGREGMYLQTPRYGLDAPLDEDLRLTAKGRLLARMHQVLRQHQTRLLEGDRREIRREDGCEEIRWTLGEAQLRMVAHHADRRMQLFDESDALLFDTHAAEPKIAPADWTRLAAPLRWAAWEEPLPGARADRPVVAREPVEQLALTRDRTDYCWYSTVVEVAGDGRCRLEIPAGADYFHVWLDGRRVAGSEPPFRENRGPTLPDDPAHPRVIANILDRESGGFAHAFTFEAVPGRRRLDLLAAALGLVKGDWQVAGPMTTERKGIWRGVRWNGSDLHDWEMRPGLTGESGWPMARAPGAELRPLTWLRARFRVSPAERSGDFRLDADGLGKGLLYLNGRLLARYWLIPADGYGPDELWQDKERHGLSADPAGPPTQRYYQLPRSWLEAENELVLLEELAATPSRVALQWRPAGG